MGIQKLHNGSWRYSIPSLEHLYDGLCPPSWKPNHEKLIYRAWIIRAMAFFFTLEYHRVCLVLKWVTNLGHHTAAHVCKVKFRQNFHPPIPCCDGSLVERKIALEHVNLSTCLYHVCCVLWRLLMKLLLIHGSENFGRIYKPISDLEILYLYLFLLSSSVKPVTQFWRITE